MGEFGADSSEYSRRSHLPEHLILHNMTTDLEKSFKAKLRTIAKEKNRDPADLWQSLTLERFLVRLARSKYRAQFVLKGGILLSRYLEIGRETTDLDFLAKKISNQVSSLQVVFEEIVRGLISMMDSSLKKSRLAN
ncbi:nucleotidyl transferase AbiEii/AbiGii toxin family protein [Candidatus Protochlamydia sp. W-9]|uniref:nucleotidyl transferase AbiEii/AbiGii toxin family protein n=1 Tax=Candidatus Protochlamydia sp. W-9 TaxID=1785087 RepID=UPI0009AE8F56|nr:nucleotidyl transferase AbiEii/AbiGii toxin family protein [Candidatus Protochlamydia sp. W-9]